MAADVRSAGIEGAGLARPLDLDELVEHFMLVDEDVELSALVYAQQLENTNTLAGVLISTVHWINTRQRSGHRAVGQRVQVGARQGEHPVRRDRPRPRPPTRRRALFRFPSKVRLSKALSKGLGIAPEEVRMAIEARPNRAVAVMCTVLLLLGLGACSRPGNGVPVAEAPSTRSAPQAPYPGTDEGARALMERLGAVGDVALVSSLRPTRADYEAVFEPSFAARAERFYESRFWASQPSAMPFAKPGQTELRMWNATTEELRSWTPRVQANFPGGYEKVKDEFRPGFTVYVWKLVKPGEQYGMAFNGLVFVNQHWAYFPKPWYVLDAPN